jgi:hypothetical protein
MSLSKTVNKPVQLYTLLYDAAVIKLFFTFHKIADHIAHQYAGIVK